MKGIAGRLLLATLSMALALLALEAALALLLPRRGGPGPVRALPPRVRVENRPDAGRRDRRGRPTSTATTATASGTRGRSPTRSPRASPACCSWGLVLLGLRRRQRGGRSRRRSSRSSRRRSRSSTAPAAATARTKNCSGCRGGVRYRPDVVVVGLFPANDWEDISTPVRHGRAKPYLQARGAAADPPSVPVPDPAPRLAPAHRDAAPPAPG